jgi:D-alanyl-D-alanine carboxypeptidase
MNYSEPARTTPHWIPGIFVIGLLVAIVVLTAILGYPLLASSPSTAPLPIPLLHQEDRGAPSEPNLIPRNNTSIFNDETPSVANLNPALLNALRQAATDAANDGVEFLVESGWRSPEYQNQLRREAVFTYGSEAEAARWVATAETSAHVSGDAVDIAPFDAMAWLSAHGAKYGLCQIYSNEPWHYELRPEAGNDGCPPMYADPTQDPRMQQ